MCFSPTDICLYDEDFTTTILGVQGNFLHNFGIHILKFYGYYSLFVTGLFSIGNTVNLYFFLFVTDFLSFFLTATSSIFTFVAGWLSTGSTVNLYIFLFVAGFHFGFSTVNLYIFLFVAGLHGLNYLFCTYSL